MDLSAFDAKHADNGADMVLENPSTGEAFEHKGKPITIRLAGTDSKVYRKKAKEINDKRLVGMMKNRNKAPSMSEREQCELLASCTLGWYGVGNADGDITFSYDAAVDLYEQFPWIKDQVDAFIGDRANFFKSA